MGKLEELDKLNRAIQDVDLRLKSIQANIDKIDNEINILVPQKNELKKNIEFHKSSGTIPLAHEFKKSRAELSKVTARLILITFDRSKAAQACKEIDNILEKFKRDQAKLLKTNENNVLRVIFGGYRGKK